MNFKQIGARKSCEIALGMKRFSTRPVRVGSDLNWMNRAQVGRQVQVAQVGHKPGRGLTSGKRPQARHSRVGRGQQTWSAICGQTGCMNRWRRQWQADAAPFTGSMRPVCTGATAAVDGSSKSRFRRGGRGHIYSGRWLGEGVS